MITFFIPAASCTVSLRPSCKLTLLGTIAGQRCVDVTLWRVMVDLVSSTRAGIAFEICLPRDVKSTQIAEVMLYTKA